MTELEKDRKLHIYEKALLAIMNLKESNLHLSQDIALDALFQCRIEPEHRQKLLPL
jgi:hypothetical protein